MRHLLPLVLLLGFASPSPAEGLRFLRTGVVAKADEVAGKTIPEWEKLVKLVDPIVRRDAAATLNLIARRHKNQVVVLSPEDLTALRAALVTCGGSPSPEVKMLGLEGFLAVGGAEAVPLFTLFLAKSNQPKTSVLVIEALGEIANAPAVKALSVRISDGGEHSTVRAAAATALGKAATEEAVKALQAELTRCGKNPELKTAIEEALNGIDKRNGVKF